MSLPPDKIPPLPRVAAPPGWSWHYFRIRYLPAVTGGLAMVAAVWLWAANSPKATGEGSAATVLVPGSNREHQAAALSTNALDLQTAVTNGNLSLDGGL